MRFRIEIEADSIKELLMKMKSRELEKEIINLEIEDEFEQYTIDNQAELFYNINE